METHARVRHVTSTTEMKLWEQSRMVQWKIVTEAKQESLLLYTENYSCGLLQVYSTIQWLTFEASLALVTQHNEMVVNSVHPCCDVTNYIHSNTGRYVWISPIVLVVYGVTCSLVHRIRCTPVYIQVFVCFSA